MRRQQYTAKRAFLYTHIDMFVCKVTQKLIVEFIIGVKATWSCFKFPKVSAYDGIALNPFSKSISHHAICIQSARAHWHPFSWECTYFSKTLTNPTRNVSHRHLQKIPAASRAKENFERKYHNNQKQRQFAILVTLRENVLSQDEPF